MFYCFHRLANPASISFSPCRAIPDALLSRLEPLQLLGVWIKTSAVLRGCRLRSTRRKVPVTQLPRGQSLWLALGPAMSRAVSALIQKRWQGSGQVALEPPGVRCLDRLSRHCNTAEGTNVWSSFLSAHFIFGLPFPLSAFVFNHRLHRQCLQVWLPLSQHSDHSEKKRMVGAVKSPRSQAKNANCFSREKLPTPQSLFSPPISSAESFTWVYFCSYTALTCSSSVRKCPLKSYLCSDVGHRSTLTNLLSAILHTKDQLLMKEAAEIRQLLNSLFMTLLLLLSLFWEVLLDWPYCLICDTFLKQHSLVEDT